VSNPVQGQSGALGSQSHPQNASLPSRLLEQMREKPLLPLLIAGAAVLAIVSALLLWAREPEYRTLYSSLSEADGGRIIAELEKRGVPYRLSEGGQALLVPAEQMHRLRLQLAEQGLPQGGNVGFELIENQAFGVSQFAEQVNFQRGLEGELARSIESLGPVARARIHLAMAKQSVFVREREPASASAVLTLHPGRELGEGQVNAIIHMISSSVPGLAADAVTVVDQSGRLLSQPAAATRDLDGTQLDYIDEVERSYQRRIEHILTPILGAENVRAQVVAQVDFSSREETAERYGPNQPPNEAAVRSQQLTENYIGGDEKGRGVPGALSNSPPNNPPASQAQATTNAPVAGAPANATPGTATGAGSNGGGTPPSSVRRDNMINYEVDRSVEHVQHRRGNVQRLSAAVVINHRARVDENGETVHEALSSEELDRIKLLVRQAMGFSAERGDELEVINSPFAPRNDTVAEPDWWKTPEFLNLATSLGRYLLVAFIALLLWLAVLRPLMRRHTQATETALTLAAAAEAQAAEAGETPQPLNPEEAAQQRQMRRKSSIYEHNLQNVREMAKEDPRLVAMIVRGWMSKND